MTDAQIRMVLWRAWRGQPAAEIAAGVQVRHQDVVAVLREMRARLTGLGRPAAPSGPASNFGGATRWQPKHDKDAMIEAAVRVKRADPGLSLAQVAARIGVPHGTLRPYLSRAGVRLSEAVPGSSARPRGRHAALSSSGSAGSELPDQADATTSAVGTGTGAPLGAQPRVDKSASVHGGPVTAKQPRRPAGELVTPRGRHPSTGPGERGTEAQAAGRIMDLRAPRAIEEPVRRDAFSADEQREIERAVAAGKVRRIEQGDWPDAGRVISKWDPRRLGDDARARMAAGCRRRRRKLE